MIIKGLSSIFTILKKISMVFDFFEFVRTKAHPIKHRSYSTALGRITYQLVQLFYLLSKDRAADLFGTLFCLGLYVDNSFFV